jgi:Zn finger protein HypA/HybF involved in hydrogenase expression
MHELSLALEVCRMARERLPPDPAVRVLSVGVEVGRDAGIEVANFRFCLEALLLEPPFVGARTDLVEQAGPDLRLAYLEVDDGR